MMTIPIRQPGFDYMTFGDFEELLADKPADERWELIGGRVVKMMVGARWEHNFLVQNLSAGIRDRLRAMGSACRTLTETFYFKDMTLDAAMLPDVMVQCGPMQPGATWVESPVVLIEVLSTGTEARDRLFKWHVYQRVASLKHYVLVSQDRAHIEIFGKVDGAWTGLKIIDGLEQVLALPAIHIEIPLAEIYRDVLVG